MKKLDGFDMIEVDIEYPSIECTIEGILNHLKWYEENLWELDGLTLYSDKSGHIGDSCDDKYYIGFDNLEDCVKKLLTFTAQIISWEKKSLFIDILDFRGFNVARIEEKITDNDLDWTEDGLWLVHDGIMKNRKDKNGLLNFLISKNILPSSSTLIMDDYASKNK